MSFLHILFSVTDVLQFNGVDQKDIGHLPVQYKNYQMSLMQ